MDASNLTTRDDKGISGDGDGVKHFAVIRHPVPSSRKFTPTVRKTEDMRSKLELALTEMKSPNKKGLRMKHRTECSSVDTPIRIPNRKCLESAKNNEKIGIYCSPRGTSLREKFPEDAARLVLRYLLLISWRKSRSRCSDLSSWLANKEEKINQLHMQIDVLQNLRKSESSKREEVAVKYHELKKDFEDIVQDNIALRNHIECLDRDKLFIINELKEVNEKSQFYQQEIREKNDSINAITEKFHKEKEKLKKIDVEEKNAQEQNYKLEYIINIQKENLENLESCVEDLQKSKLDLNSQLETSQENCKNHLERLRSLIIEHAKNESRISAYEMEKEEMSTKLYALQKQLEIVLKEHSDLKDKNQSIQLEIQEFTMKYEKEKQCFRNSLRKGIISTNAALKYLAAKIVPALQAYLTSL